MGELSLHLQNKERQHCGASSWNSTRPTRWWVYGLLSVLRIADGAQVSQMEIEIQGIPQSLRPKYQTRIKTAKVDLQRYKKLSKDQHTQLARSDLLGARGNAAMTTSDEPYGTSDRTRLLAGTSLLEDGSRRLADSQRIALETEEQGADILRSLRGQREQIQNARDTVCTSFVVPCCLLTESAFTAPASGYLDRPCVRDPQEDDTKVRRCAVAVPEILTEVFDSAGCTSNAW